MTELGIDYAWARPSPAGIKAAGYTTVMRYLCIGDTIKELSTGEARLLHDAGLSIGLVWETTASRAGQGFAAGAQDAATAKAHAAALGFPAECPIFFAVDYDALVSAITPYFKGVASVALGHPVGVYGSFYVVDAMLAAGLADYGWQTMAWSGGNVSTKAHLFQILAHSHTIDASTSGWDENQVRHPFPRWTSSGSTTGDIFMALTDAQQADLLATVKSTAAAQASLVSAQAARYQTETARYAALVGLVKGIPTDPGVSATDIAAAIAAAIPESLAVDVANELGKRLNAPRVV